LIELKTALFARFVLHEQPLRVSGEFEKLHAFVQVGAIGRLQPFDLAQAAILFLAPLVRHALEERRIDQPLELIDIHGVNALIKPLVFGLMAPDRLLVLAALVCVARVQRFAHPFEHFVVSIRCSRLSGASLNRPIGQ
jgi:hypothetical protein